jgi:exopolysaccharide production protein ExoZ
VILYGGLSFLVVVFSTLLDKEAAQTPGIRPSFVRRLLLHLGDASYSIYLSHGPCVSALFKAAIVFGVASRLGVTTTTIAIVAVAIMVGSACHIFVENPVLGLLRARLVGRGGTVISKGADGILPISAQFPGGNQ